MDKVIEKLVDQHQFHIQKIYGDMESRRIEINADKKEIHERIDYVLEKIQDTERRLLDEIKNIRDIIQIHNSKEENQLNKMMKWGWMLFGGIAVLVWLLSHVDLEMLIKAISTAPPR
jgi:hypothetical protein